MDEAELPLLPGALHFHEEAAGEGGLPARRCCVLHAEGSRLGLDLLHRQILELLSNGGGFQFDAVDGCNKKKWVFLKKTKCQRHLQTKNTTLLVIRCFKMF